MGAISGIVGERAGRPVERATVERMIDSMQYRGPDRAGVWVSDRVGLAQRGLALEHEAGRAQPLRSADGTLAIVFSGELFNRAELRSELEHAGPSDADVALRSYQRHGESCVARFNGQFALAIWDGRTDSVFLARDAIGVCPLHYAIVDGALLFASEAKGVLAHPGIAASSDDEAVGEALLCGAIFEDKTLFAGVKSLPPGSTLTAGLSGRRTSVYWSVPSARNGEAAERATSDVIRLPDVLQDAIRCRIDDTSGWGVLLSGGTDSSALTAWSQRLSRAPVQTFSIDFPDAWRGDDIDTRYAAAVAGALGTRHRAFEADPEEYFAALETLAAYVERPYNKAAATMYLLAARAAPYARYVLSGEGMDEMLAGYVGARGLGLDDDELRPGGLRCFPWAPYAESMHRLLSDEFDEAVRLSDLVEARLHDALAAAPGADALNRMLHLYTTHFLRELLALHEQGSLVAGVEARFPFLDRRVVELLAPLPSSWKCEQGQTKVVLRQIIKDLVPPQVLERRKTHLPMPRDPRAVSRQLGLARELLCGPGARTARYFDRGRLARFLDMRAGEVEMLTVWQVSMNLITLELLYRHFRL